MVVPRQFWLVAVAAAFMCAGCGGGGSAPTEWHLDPNADKPTPSATVLHVVVSDDQCGAARKQAESIGGPAITYLGEEIRIQFSVKALSGTYACVALPNSSVTRTIHLDQPIGSRRLIDTGRGLPGFERFPIDSP